MLRALEVVFAVGGGDEAPVFTENDGFYAGGADIEADNGQGGDLLLRDCPDPGETITKAAVYRRQAVFSPGRGSQLE